MEKRFVGIEEMAEYLGLKKGTLYAWIFRREIPYLKIGRLVKFDIMEIEKWLKEKRVKEIA